MTFRMWYIDDSGQENLVAFDCVLSEQLEALVQTTKHPIETGSSITDHQRPSPRTFGLEAVVSNTPIRDPTQNGDLDASFETLELDYPRYTPPLRATPGSLLRAGSDALAGDPGPAKVIALRFGVSPFDRIKEVSDQLELIRTSAYLLRLETSFGDLEDVVLLRYTPGRRSENGSSANFNLDFEIFKIVTTEEVPANVVAEALAGLKTKGAPSSAAKGDPAAKQSLAKRLVSSDNPLATIASFL